MIHVKQTRKTNCGQACLAMILHWSPALVERKSGSRGGKTNYRQLREMLISLSSNWRIGETIRIGTADFPDDILLCKVAGYDKKWKHWVLLDRAVDQCRLRRVFDPALSETLTLSQWSRHYSDRVRITSYAVVAIPLQRSYRLLKKAGL